MGTREVYEEKLRSGNLHYDPTIKPGLGSARCPRCLSLVDPNSGSAGWTITSVLHDATAVAGSGAAAMLSAVHGFNTGIPFVQKHVKGPRWLQLLIGIFRVILDRFDGIFSLFYEMIPPLLVFSGASAAFGGYAVPKFAQLTVTSYYTASNVSQHAISRATRYIEETHSSHGLHEKSR